MRESTERLRRRIDQGEDGSLELKEVLFAGSRISGPRRNELADELAAFANGGGGAVILGVRDTREVVGIEPDRQAVVERYVSELVQDSIEPALYPEIDWYELPDAAGRGVQVLRVHVERSLLVHRSPGGYLRRVGSSKRQLAPQYLERLFQQRSQERLVRFDEQVVPGVSPDDLDPDLIDRFRSPRSRDDRETLAHKLAILALGDRERFGPTVAGVLLCCRRPERWLPQALIQAVAYRGTSVGESIGSPYYQLDARDIKGPLDLQVAEACGFVARNQKVRAHKTMGRRDVPQYDMTAVFEAVVNAVAHRDYALRESKIRLRMFADRLEICSPGGLPNTLTVDTLAYRQASRNETVASLLARCPVPDEIPDLQTSRLTLMDRRGEGVSAIFERSEELSGKQPVYELFDDSEVRLTIFAAGPEED